MKYTSLDLTVMMNETIDRIHELNDEIEQFENGVTARYDELIDRYGFEPDEDSAMDMEDELNAMFKGYNKMIDIRDSSRKLYDLLESAQMELEYIELVEQDLNKLKAGV